MTIQFAHPAYQLATTYAARGGQRDAFQTWSLGDTRARLADAEVLVLSGFWQDDFLDLAPNLKYIHVCAAGIDQFDQEAIRARNIRLTNSSGVNQNAVADHGMALMLSLSRQLHTARDRQAQHQWRGMIADISKREDELTDKTLLIYGLGGIGVALAKRAKAFGMQVIGIKRQVGDCPPNVDTVLTPDHFTEALATTDVLALTCPLTEQTRGLVDRSVLAALPNHATVLNLARGPVVVEADMVEALQQGQIAGAGLDVFDPEPLPESSILWDLENAILTPHTGGETRSYEENVMTYLLENLSRLEAGRDDLVNEII